MIPTRQYPSTGDPCALADCLVATLILSLTAPPLLPGSSLPALSQTDRKAEADGEALREANRLLKQAGEQANQKQTAAIQSYQQALTLYRTLKNRAGEQKALTGLGYFYAGQSNYAKGVEYLEQALTIAQERGDRPTLALLQGTLGALYGLLSQVEKAPERLSAAACLRAKHSKIATRKPRH